MTHTGNIKADESCHIAADSDCNWRSDCADTRRARLCHDDSYADLTMLDADVHETIGDLDETQSNYFRVGGQCLYFKYSDDLIRPYMPHYDPSLITEDDIFATCDDCIPVCTFAKTVKISGLSSILGACYPIVITNDDGAVLFTFESATIDIGDSVVLKLGGIHSLTCGEMIRIGYAHWSIPAYTSYGELTGDKCYLKIPIYFTFNFVKTGVDAGYWAIQAWADNVLSFGRSCDACFYSSSFSWNESDEITIINEGRCWDDPPSFIPNCGDIWSPTFNGTNYPHQGIGTGNATSELTLSIVDDATPRTTDVPDIPGYLMYDCPITDPSNPPLPPLPPAPPPSPPVPIPPPVGPPPATYKCMQVYELWRLYGYDGGGGVGYVVQVNTAVQCVEDTGQTDTDWGDVTYDCSGATNHYNGIVATCIKYGPACTDAGDCAEWSPTPPAAGGPCAL